MTTSDEYKALADNEQAAMDATWSEWTRSNFPEEYNHSVEVVAALREAAQLAEELEAERNRIASSAYHRKVAARLAQAEAVIAQAVDFVSFYEQSRGITLTLDHTERGDVDLLSILSTYDVEAHQESDEV